MSMVRTNRWVTHEAIAECVTDVLTTFWRLLWSITKQTYCNMESIFLYNKEENTDEAFLIISESFTITPNRAFAHFSEHEKKPFDVIYCLFEMKQYYWLLCVAKTWFVQPNHATVKLDSKIASREMKTYSEIRIELQNLKILNWEDTKKVSPFLSLWQPCEPKSLDAAYVSLNIAGLKNTLGKLAVVVNIGGHSIWVLLKLKGHLMTAKICVLCGWWFW